MKTKTSELTGIALDWAVAKVAGHVIEHAGGTWFYIPMMDQDKIGTGYSPSTQAWRAWPIIEREMRKGMNLYSDGSIFGALYYDVCAGDSKFSYFGPTSLVAAMRCYVGSELGDEIDVPEELLT